ncbi:hypothetical protein [Hydrogenoanaerobacterium sp.]|uniref:hypothetical protein n=1 Tax=Hydrogenoanaerobacterium sp. TaxID=2953763 RepID=UPI002896F06D|nr:hypothetical protein [Hydrogenoanaerobacterium sp.]
MTNKLKFIGKVTVVHMFTYILCGMVFSSVFNYNELFALGNAKYFMRGMGAVSSLIGPVLQVLRGVLFGLALLLFQDSFMGKKNGWLKLWAIILVIGIINTPGPAPCSIEGIIYTQLPLEFHLKGAPEIIVQTLLFSWLVTRESSNARLKLSLYMKRSLTVAAIAGVGFSLSGIVLALIIGADFMAGATDLGAFAVMFLALIVVFFATRWKLNHKNRGVSIVYYGVCYAALAVLPTLYNFATNSQFKSYLSLAISGIPVLIIALYLNVSHIRK